jgi:hypothetical protein
MFPEKLFAEPDFSMLLGIFAKACIFGRFQPQSSSLGKHCLIIVISSPRSVKEQRTCALECGSATQHSYAKYCFRQYINLFIGIFFVLFHLPSISSLNVSTSHKVTQSSSQLSLNRTFWCHQLFHYVWTPLRMDMRGKSRLLCLSVLMTKHR